MSKYIIFDLDGVIVSTDEIHYFAWKKLADREKIYFDKKINNRLRGVSRRDSLMIILEKSDKVHNEVEIDEMLEFKNTIYRSSLKKLSKKDILDNFCSLFDFLRSINVKIAVASSSENAKTILTQIGLIHIFDAIVDGTDIVKSKPDPEVFLIAAKRLKAEPKDCFVVEDAVAGIKAAKSADMNAIAINDAKNTDLADYKIDNLLEIKDIILGGKR
ncbi:beta-phosphoglucomutase [Candidatus Izemoplasma sp. B36]|uniref:beta-phosphoglucomutase n=1 Tax=Candidatus Izemoplasma sp. B36 TaxID=3242468 RepID=UPI0035586C2B